MRETSTSVSGITDLRLALGNDHAAQLIHYEKVQVAGSAAEELLKKREDRAHSLRRVFQRHSHVTQHDHDVLRNNFAVRFLIALAETEIFIYKGAHIMLFDKSIIINRQAFSLIQR